LVVRCEKGVEGERVVVETFEAAVVDEVGQHLGRGIVEGDHYAKGLQTTHHQHRRELVRCHVPHTLGASCARKREDENKEREK
jgi:hypothetical protein